MEITWQYHLELDSMLLGVLDLHIAVQDMLGDALGELKYLRACQQLGDRSLKVLQRKASLAVLRAKKNMQKEQNAGQVRQTQWCN